MMSHVVARTSSSHCTTVVGGTQLGTIGHVDDDRER